MWALGLRERLLRPVLQFAARSYNRDPDKKKKMMNLRNVRRAKPRFMQLTHAKRAMIADFRCAAPKQPCSALRRPCACLTAERFASGSAFTRVLASGDPNALNAVGRELPDTVNAGHGRGLWLLRLAFEKREREKAYKEAVKNQRLKKVRAQIAEAAETARLDEPASP